MNKKRKFVIWLGSSSFFGAERRLMKLANLLTVEIKEVDIYLVIPHSLYLASRENEPAKIIFDKFDLDNKLIILPHNFNIILSKRLFLLFKLMLTKTKFMLSLGAHKYFKILKLFGNKPVLEITSPDIAKGMRRRMSPKFFSSISKFICVSPNVRRILLAGMNEGGYEKYNDKVVCYQAPFFSVPEKGVFQKEKLIVSSSRMIKRKNVHLFAEAYKRIAHELPEWKVMILGSGELELDIKESLKELIEANVVEVGYNPDVTSVLKRSSLYVSFIYPDNYPSQGVVEAMSYCNALLLSNTGDSHKFIYQDEKGVNGELVSLDIDEMALKIKAFCTHYDKLLEMGGQSYKGVSLLCDKKKYLDYFLNINELA